MTYIQDVLKNYFDDILPHGHLAPYDNFAVKMAPLTEQKHGKLVIVSSMTPNPKGAGKTTTTIGLADALTHKQKKAAPVLRQPSLGPVLGRKGGATGGGKASLQFENQINFHFTGDIHAISAAHNAISAQIDNEIFFETDLNIDKDNIVWPHCLDINERALREITIHYPTKPHLDHKGQFIITVASELMSIISIVTSIAELKMKIDNMLVAYTKTQQPVFVSDLGITDAVAIILERTLSPNLTLTLEETPAFIHGGAFANIAHGTTTVSAIKSALAIADYAICETGFGADLGFEKFIHLIAGEYNLIPDHLILVVSIPMLKALAKDQLDLSEGLLNLKHHIQWIKQTGVPITIALNQFADTTPAEITFLKQWALNEQVAFGISNGFAEGGAGCTELADCILNQTPTQQFTPLYQKEATLIEKITAIATKVYGAEKIALSPLAQTQLALFKEHNWDHFPICVAKSPFSLLPENPTAPQTLLVTSMDVRTGAQFIIIHVDSIIAMPALPRDPNAKHMHISDDGIITVQ